MGDEQDHLTGRPVRLVPDGQCYNNWNSDEEAITAVIITVASLVSRKFETAFRQFASQSSMRMLGNNFMNGPDAQYILLVLYDASHAELLYHVRFLPQP